MEIAFTYLTKSIEYEENRINLTYGINKFEEKRVHVSYEIDKFVENCIHVTYEVNKIEKNSSRNLQDQ